MRKGLVIILGLVLCLAFAPAAFADRSGDATAHVYVWVDPNITVNVVTGNVDLGSVQTGEFSGSIEFRVDSNVEQVGLWCAVSNLYKGDLNDGFVDPIQVSGPATIAPTNATPQAGGSNVGALDVDADVNGLPGKIMAGPIFFESSQDGHFSQNVLVSCGWNQDDPEKTIGEYSGFVILYAIIL